MSFNGANINKLNGGLGQTSDTPDRVIVLVAGMTLPSGMVYNDPIELLDITGAEDFGITESSDNLNTEQTWYHLSEMFRLAPGVTFWLIAVDKTKTISQLVADVALNTALRAIPSINVIGLAGLTDKVTAALTIDPVLQAWVESFAAGHLLIDGIFWEGVGADAPILITAYPDRRSITAPNISCVVALDPAIAALHTEYAKRGAVGTVLGSVAVRKIHEDLGSVDIEEKPRARKGEENYSLSDEALGRWMSASLSDGTKFKSLTPAEQTELTKRGYIYAGSFDDYGGIYLNGCPTGVSKSSDYAYFNYNCIWNKAARIIRKTLIPRVRSKAPSDPTTGYLKSTWVSSCDGLIRSKIETMETAGNIDGFDVYINPAQSPNETTPLKVKAKLVVGKIIHEFDVDLGLTNKL